MNLSKDNVPIYINNFVRLLIILKIEFTLKIEFDT